MSYKRRALIIFEGKTDAKQYNRLAKTFSSFLKDGEYETSILSTSIYELYKPLILEKSYDDIVSYLVINKKLVIDETTRPKDAFSLIYLVFDFDPKYHLYSEEKIKSLCDYFNDETKNGLLYINYPMVESLFDFLGSRDEYYINKSISIDLCHSNEYKKYIKDNTVFRNDKLHPFKYLPPKDFNKVCKLSYLRYCELLHLNLGTWSLTDNLKLLNTQINATKNRILYPLNCFPFMALDFNYKECFKLWDISI